MALRALRRLRPATMGRAATSMGSVRDVASVASVLAVLVLLVGCATEPAYKKPAVSMPASWKVEEPFRIGTPMDDVPKGYWWRRFGDADLDALAQQALGNSPTLALASSRLTQARASLDAAAASRFPQLGIASRDIRTRIAAQRPLNNYNAPNFSTVQTDMFGALTVAYEVDLGGRVAQTITGARATAQQIAADFENVKLLLTTDLATAYFNLRAVDIELDVVARALALQRRALDLAKSRYELGVASGVDIAQQQAVLDNTLTQVDVLKRQRAQFQHALATLSGTPAPIFQIAPRVITLTPPAVPIGVPSDVLERRPDVASAERAMAAANAQIGIANAAFYPSINLGGNYGTESRTFSNLLTTPAFIWSFGANLAQVLFDGGRLRANLANAEAGYEATVANYRRVILTAMQEVEDGIIGMSALERAHTQALVANKSAQRVLDLANARYEGGVATSLDVIVAQQALLAAERLAAQLQGQRLLTAVFLVKALGGDWDGVSAIGKL